MCYRSLAVPVAAAALGAVLGFLPAQRTSKPVDWAAEAALDPYTRNDPDRMRAAGYVSFGPFPWDMASSSTADLRSTVGEPRLRFIETAHFRLGCALAPRPLPERTRHRRMVQAELRKLRKRLPRVKRTVRTLDRWLIAHLYAQRLEDLYADFAALIDVREGDFPRSDRIGTREHYMGEGPYLGQREKYCVILFDHNAHLLRYLNAFSDYRGKVAVPVRHDFTRIGSMAFATATETGGMLDCDVHMHAHVASEVAKNLATGFKSNLIQLPNWFTEGLGHYFRRQIDPQIVLMDETADPNRQSSSAWNWGKRVRARVRNEHYSTAEQLFDEHEFTTWGVQEHMMAWSRFDFLLRKDASGIRRFLDYYNDLDVPIRNANGPRQRDYQVESMRKAWGLTFADFDRQWKNFVLSEYHR